MREDDLAGRWSTAADDPPRDGELSPVDHGRPVQDERQPGVPAGDLAHLADAAADGGLHGRDDVSDGRCRGVVREQPAPLVCTESRCRSRRSDPRDLRQVDAEGEPFAVAIDLDVDAPAQDVEAKCGETAVRRALAAEHPHPFGLRGGPVGLAGREHGRPADGDALGDLRTGHQGSERALPQRLARQRQRDRP